MESSKLGVWVMSLKEAVSLKALSAGSLVFAIEGHDGAQYCLKCAVFCKVIMTSRIPTGKPSDTSVSN